MFGSKWRNVTRSWDYYVNSMEEDRNTEEDMDELAEMESGLRVITSVRTPIVLPLVC